MGLRKKSAGDKISEAAESVVTSSALPFIAVGSVALMASAVVMSGVVNHLREGDGG